MDDVTKAADERLEAIGALARALAEAQQGVAPQVRDATLKTGKKDGFDYLSAEQTIRVCREALASNGLALVVTSEVTREVVLDHAGRPKEYATAKVRGWVVHEGGGRLPVGCDRMHGGGMSGGAGTITKAYKQLLVQLLMIELVDEQEERAGAAVDDTGPERVVRPKPATKEVRTWERPRVVNEPKPKAEPKVEPKPEPTEPKPVRRTEPTEPKGRPDAANATERVNETLRRWAKRRKDLGLSREQAIEVARRALPLEGCWDGDRLLVEQVVAKGMDGEFNQGVGTYVVNRNNGLTHQDALEAVGAPF